MNDQTSGNQDGLRMREPSELIGRWTVTGGSDMANLPCTIVFSNERIEAANAWKLSPNGNCLDEVLNGAVGWRPAPDGIELVGADRRTVVMFDANGVGLGPAGQALRLARARD